VEPLDEDVLVSGRSEIVDGGFEQRDLAGGVFPAGRDLE